MQDFEARLIELIREELQRLNRVIATTSNMKVGMEANQKAMTLQQRLIELEEEHGKR